jgi:hypothetical protein
MRMMKKAQTSGIQGFIMAIVGVAVMLAVGLIVLGELKVSAVSCPTAYSTYNTTSGFCTNGSVQVNNMGEAFNATGSIVTKLATVPTWIGILITVALAFIVLGYFYSRNQ